jgi:hypothetical protein
MADRQLSVVIPVYNGAGWISGCIERVALAIDQANIPDAEFIVVDDGSTDTTVDEARNAGAVPTPVTVINQSNLGRLAARRTGLDAAVGDMVLFIDTRVRLDRTALAYVWPQLDSRVSRVWTAHVEANTDASPIAGFWQAIEHIAWSRYFRRPRHVLYGVEEFDYYPKGTTALLAPRAVLLEAFDRYVPTVDDQHIANDDTAILRYVASKYGINISPGYSCVYNSRTTLRGFMRHSRHRGAVLIDGYLRPNARFSKAITAVLATSPAALLVAVRRWKWVVPAAVASSVCAGAIARAKGARPKDSLVLGVLAIPFGVAYLTGMWEGFVARLRAMRR